MSGLGGPTLPPRPSKKSARSTTSTTSEPSSEPPAASQNGSMPAQPPSAKPASQGTAFMPTLPARQAAPASGPALDPDEPKEIQEVRQRIHEVRVSLIRVAQRLGYDPDNGLVRQVLYRLALAEKLKAPWRRGVRRADPNQVAAREASRLEAAGSSSGAGPAVASKPLGFCVKMMLVGLAGTGKTQLIHALITEPAGRGKQAGSRASGAAPGTSSAGWTVVDPIEGATHSTCIHKGEACGIPMEILDTPGLLAAAAGTAHNAAVLKQIRRAYNSFKPDLVVYVDRLDAGGACRWSGELPALRGLSAVLGPATWLNTIVALTHAGAAPPQGARGKAMSWDHWANQRSHSLQQVIRAASGDSRLMNPIAFAESHPSARRDAGGAPLLYNGMAWQPHLLLMVVSAKLLSDTENMLQMQDKDGSSGAAANAAAQQLLLAQMMGGAPRTLPLPYLTTQATQFSEPLQYPDHDQAMAVARKEAEAAEAENPRQRKQLVRQAKAMRLQIKQAQAYKDKMARSFRMATLAGSKITPAPPQLATKRPPNIHPPCSHRYRVPEPSSGWVVRPNMEPHGYDVGDGIEGLHMEQYTVVGRERAGRRKQRKPAGSSAQADGLQQHTSVQQEREECQGAASVLLGGVPVHHYVSAQATKGQVGLQGRSESTLYHDPLGNTTTSLSADLQVTQSGAGPLDALVTLRSDLRRRAVPLMPGGQSNRVTVGLVVSRLAEGGRLDRGPIALGTRLQHSMRCVVGKGRQKKKGKIVGGFQLPAPPPRPGWPLDVAAAVALMAAPQGCTSHATAASLAALGGGPPPSIDPEMCLGANLEISADGRDVLGTRHSAPVGLNATLMSYKGDLMTSLGSSLQLRGKGKDVCAMRLQWSNKGKAGVNLKVRSGPWWWVGLCAMVVPLTSLLLELAGLAV